jgi:hypothetical protein
VTGGAAAVRAVALTRHNATGAARLSLLHLPLAPDKAGAVRPTVEPTAVLVKTTFPAALCGNAAGSHCALAEGHKVTVWALPAAAKRPPAPLKLYHTKTFTCVAMDAEAARVAAGDESGRILLWHEVACACATPAVPTCVPCPSPALASLPSSHVDSYASGITSLGVCACGSFSST